MMFNTNNSTQTHTCDGVRVEVPGLFCHVEEPRDKRFRPGRQFTEKQNKKKDESRSERGKVGEGDYGGRQRDPEWFLCHL